MSATISDVVGKWAKGIADGGEDNGYKHYKGCNVYFSGRTLYSYGSHFPMAYIVSPGVVWLNGDRFSVSTSRHQAETRAACRGATTIIVPNSALQAANVDYRTIIPVDIQAERYEYTEQHSDVAPANMVPIGTPDAVKRWQSSDSTLTAENIKYASDYGNLGTVPDHIVAAAVGYVPTEGANQVVWKTAGGFAWHSGRHWLGDAVFRTPDGRYFVSSFDRQESRPLYFLSQLPGPVETFDEAIESLAPDSVKTARDMGRNVIRQGDMFAIPLDITTRELRAMGATFERRKVTVTLNESAQLGVRARKALEATRELMPTPPQRPVFNADEQTREEYAVLRDAWETARDAYLEQWATLANEHSPGIELTAYRVQSALKYAPRQWDKRRRVTGTPLYGTAHTATEVATLPNGQQFARGNIYHEPSIIGETWRNADHARRKLGNQWHILARNTVPVSGTGRGRIGDSGLRAAS